MVQGSALAMLGPCTGQVDKVLAMVMMEGATTVMEVVEDMEDNIHIHMGDSDHNLNYFMALRHICLRML